MTLAELHKSQFNKVPFIGIYKEIDGKAQPIYPEYADELLETHGKLEVKEYQFVASKNILVVEF